MQTMENRNGFVENDVSEIVGWLALYLDLFLWWHTCRYSKHISLLLSKYICKSNKNEENMLEVFWYELETDSKSQLKR